MGNSTHLNFKFIFFFNSQFSLCWWQIPWVKKHIFNIFNKFPAFSISGKWTFKFPVSLCRSNPVTSHPLPGTGSSPGAMLLQNFWLLSFSANWLAGVYQLVLLFLCATPHVEPVCRDNTFASTLTSLCQTFGLDSNPNAMCEQGSCNFWYAKLIAVKLQHDYYRHKTGSWNIYY